MNKQRDYPNLAMNQARASNLSQYSALISMMQLLIRSTDVFRWALSGCICSDCAAQAGERELREIKLARINCGPRGGTGGAKPGSGVQRFWGPLGASEFDPPFQRHGVPETPPQRPLRAPKGSQGLGGGSSEASERGVRFQRSGKTRWATQRPLRGPVFPDAP